MSKAKEVTHTTKDLFTVEEVAYSDGVVLYSLKGENEDGTSWGSGMHNSTDLIIEVLQRIGKLDKNVKTYYNTNDPKW